MTRGDDAEEERGRTIAGVSGRLTRTRLRLLLVAMLVASGAFLGYASQTGVSTATLEDVPRAEPRDGHTVVTESGRAGTIVAYGPEGNVVYYDNTRTKYFDVDPVEGEEMTVEYVATDTIHERSATCEDPPCARNLLERANLSTGEVEVIYERYDYRERAGEWHDHVRLNETHVLIADIVADQVFVVNTETEVVEWLWDAQSEFPVEGGGPYPSDWAHVNDVSRLEDGRVLVSLRNQDQVVFVDPEEGMDGDWTLGSEDDYDVLFEQHNPDYVPRENGGPAVVLADSENARVQEFQRVDGEWKRTWVWSDERLQWPRDADRLPGGNTLIVDSHGKRVLEVAPDGEIEWSVDSTLPYDAERLETGDESAGGRSATALGLESRTDDDGVSDGNDGMEDGNDGTENGGGISPLGLLSSIVQAVLPHRVFNGILYVSPAWMGRPQFAAAAVGVVSGFAWIGLELRWRLRATGFGVRSPLYRRDERE